MLFGKKLREKFHPGYSGREPAGVIPGLVFFFQPGIPFTL